MAWLEDLSPCSDPGEDGGLVLAVDKCPPMRSPKYLEALRAVAPPWMLEAGPLPWAAQGQR